MSFLCTAREGKVARESWFAAGYFTAGTDQLPSTRWNCESNSSSFIYMYGGALARDGTHALDLLAANYPLPGASLARGNMRIRAFV